MFKIFEALAHLVVDIQMTLSNSQIRACVLIEIKDAIEMSLLKSQLRQEDATQTFFNLIFVVFLKKVNLKDANVTLN